MAPKREVSKDSFAVLYKGGRLPRAAVGILITCQGFDDGIKGTALEMICEAFAVKQPTVAINEMLGLIELLLNAWCEFFKRL